jgi:group I intron endonuclease
MRIYKITNKLNGKIYVGQTHTSLAKRFQRHCWASEYKKNMPICLAIKKYGKDNFDIEEIEVCLNQCHLNEREKYWVSYFHCFSPKGYNLRAGNGRGAMNQSTKEKISQALIGIRRSLQTKQKLSKSHLGFRVSEDTKRKLSEINQGKQPHSNTRLGASKNNAKTYILVSPTNEIQTIKNMRHFCKVNGLCYTSMISVASGQQTSCQGWRKS